MDEEAISKEKSIKDKDKSSDDKERKIDEIILKM
jgi:hypothetical protein